MSQLWDKIDLVGTVHLWDSIEIPGFQSLEPLCFVALPLKLVNLSGAQFCHLQHEYRETPLTCLSREANEMRVKCHLLPH